VRKSEEKLALMVKQAGVRKITRKGFYSFSYPCQFISFLAGFRFLF
jgi:hypothetical protein